MPLEVNILIIIFRQEFNPQETLKGWKKFNQLLIICSQKKALMTANVRWIFGPEHTCLKTGFFLESLPRRLRAQVCFITYRLQMAAISIAND